MKGIPYEIRKTHPGSSRSCCNPRPLRDHIFPRRIRKSEHKELADGVRGHDSRRPGPDLRHVPGHDRLVYLLLQ